MGGDICIFWYTAKFICILTFTNKYISQVCVFLIHFFVLFFCAILLFCEYSFIFFLIIFFFSLNATEFICVIHKKYSNIYLFFFLFILHRSTFFITRSIMSC